MADDLIGYEGLTRAALLGVVREALKVAERGLPGEHHFYISFKSQARGVELPAVLVERYPDEITIVLQHQYEGLKVREDGFQVRLHFGGTPYQLRVPFAALTRFYDPSVRFALPFEVDEDLLAPSEPPPAAADAAPDADAAPAAPSTPGQVVSLDAFRRKP